MRLINVLFCIIILFAAICAGIPAGMAGDRSAALLTAGTLYGQVIQKPLQAPSQDAEIKPDPSTTLFQVMGVVLFIWIGLALFLFRLDRRMTRLERRLQNNQ